MTSTADQTRHQGVIHDIGYRHYDGPRLGRGYIVRTLLLDGVRGAYGLGRSMRSKIVPMLLLAALCMPALVIVAVNAITKLQVLPFGYADFVLDMQVLISVFVATQAPAMLSRDLRHRVMPLYFSRPMQRGDYVLAKYAAMTVALFALIAAPLTILFLGAMLAELPLDEHLPDYLRAIVSALLHAATIAGIGLVIATITTRRGLGVAAIVTVLLIASALQSIVQEIASGNDTETLAEYAGLLSPYTLVAGLSHQLLGADSVLAREPSGAIAMIVFAGATLLLLAGTWAALMLRYRRLPIS